MLEFFFTQLKLAEKKIGTSENARKGFRIPRKNCRKVRTAGKKFECGKKFQYQKNLTEKKVWNAQANF